MSDQMRFNEKVKITKARKRAKNDILLFKGRWEIEQKRNGVVIATRKVNNIITKQGKNYILGTGFYSVSQIATASWFGGLINTVGYTAGVSTNDTSASHTGWAEFTQYSESTRPVWGQGAPTNEAITNPTAMLFTISANGTLKGMLMISNPVKGAATGILWSAATFDDDVPVEIGDEMKATYALAC